MMEIGIDLENGKDFTVDNLIRHKWPEEKPEYDPENQKEYLIYGGGFVVGRYHPEGYFYYYDGGDCFDVDRDIYWWELPEV